MGDESTKPILGHRNVVSEFSSGKTITLVNVVYVLGLRKNLMSSPVLNKGGYKQVYESDKYILLRRGVFVGFSYYNNGMFMLNLNKVHNAFNSVCMISSKDVYSSMWHACLGHVHYKRMLAMSKDNLIPEFDITLGNYNTRMLTKITRQPFKDIKRDSNVLELIHGNLCDFHATPSLGNKKYVVTFIDDASRFCYVYLCHAKDEALDKFKIFKTEESYMRLRLFTHHNKMVCSKGKKALKEMVNSMLSYSGLSEGFWGEAISNEDQISETPIKTPTTRRSNGARVTKSFGYDFQLYFVEGSRDEIGPQYSYCYSIEEDPRMFDEAMQSYDVAFWKEAINDEMDSIMENNTCIFI
ncbi:zinc finger, CCHC-type containing protein [Tanacetum coccineum]